MGLKLDLSGIKKFINFEKESQKLISKIKTIHQNMQNKRGVGKDFLGWLDLPFKVNSQEIIKINQIKSYYNLEVLIVIGAGGSYYGVKAGLDFLKFDFVSSNPQIIFAGYQISGFYLSNLIKYLKNKNWAINVISKSGNTIEPAIAFRILKQELEVKFGKKETKKRIFVTTSKNKGNLFKLALQEGYEVFDVPESVSGRFSVLSAVGFLPFIFANINIENILKGARDAFYDTSSCELSKNLSYQYAVSRFCLYQNKKHIELLVSYEPSLISFTDWWKQLFGESEGKNGKSLFPCGLYATSELHSLGQYLQEGPKIFFETILNVKNIPDDCLIPDVFNDIDKLNYLSNKSLSYVNQHALNAVKIAHIQGNVPNIEITFDYLDEYHFGYLVYFFEKACALSAYLLEVNPFDQPGVENYKKNLLSLLGKK
ncbi:Glucose-6-phosphate isomerase [Candidatus Phytoplasma mali]|uniref:Glucose-6-phosphate isomerase n=1 Tax=Phytoplasma mali (strain AT) TaxID=482235 RepID=B3QZF7_PHYMT|nr:glucose-6-phosphate isomerase [Candidatus Phytoplasma mali]CAP18564.1 Glucose-6-phosphate isomerase [Candidatus Phytoplasma mali]